MTRTPRRGEVASARVELAHLALETHRVQAGELSRPTAPGAARGSAGGAPARRGVPATTLAALVGSLAVPLAAALVGTVAAATASCAPRQTATAVNEGPLRRTELAERLTRQAAGLTDRDPPRAERLLREAVAADPYHGPARNNLGALLLARGELGAAAEQLEAARRLLPGHPDPRLNLGLVHERAGRIDRALELYGDALEAAPDHVPSMQALARLQVWAGRRDARTRGLLETIALRGEDPAWRDWARLQLTRTDR